MSALQTSFYRQEVTHLSEGLGRFLSRKWIFPPTVAVRGVVVQQPRGARLPKAQKWTHILPGVLEVTAGKQSLGCDVVFVDGSKDARHGVHYAGYGVWFGDHAEKNECRPVPAEERHSIT